MIALDRAAMDAFTAGVEHGYSAGWDAGHAAADEEMAALQRRAMRVVHAAARRPVREPMVLELTADQMARVHADRDRVRGEAFRAGLRVGRGQGVRRSEKNVLDRGVAS